jgi:hypothetical protein
LSYNSWNQSLITQQVDGTALATSTTATSLLAPAARFTLPANLLQVGTKLKVKASGRISTVVTTPGTLTLDVRLGASTVIFNGGAMNLNVTAQTNAAWEFEADLLCRSIGNGTVATILGTGKFLSRALIGSPAVAAGYAGAAILPDTAPVVGTGFDSTVAQTLDFFGTWSVSNAANSILCHQFELVLCN